MTNFDDRDLECAQVIRALTTSFDRLGQAWAERHGIYQTDFRALLLIAGRGEDEVAMTAGELASALGLSSGTVTYLVERLTQSGYVRRAIDPCDRRKVRLVATQRGTDLVQSHSLPVCDAIRNALAGQDEGAMTQVHSLLTGVTAGLDMATARLRDEPRHATVG